MPGDKIKATKKKKEKNTVFYSFQDKESVYFNGLQLKAGLKIPYKFILTNTPVKQDPSKRTRNVEELVAEGRRLQKLGSNENLIPHLEGLAAISFPVADSAVVTENATADVEPEQGSSKRKRPEKSNSGEPLDHDEEDIEVEGRPSKILNTRSGEESSESIEHVSSNEIIQQNGKSKNTAKGTVFTCKDCSKTFSRKHGVARHMEIHLKNRLRYPCVVEGCKDRSYLVKNDFKKHLKTFHGIEDERIAPLLEESERNSYMDKYTPRSFT